jgi:glycine cleavage system aminomethyltransferase T/glycine/D-amino acid oxidase-like deaminating enzyme
MSKKVVIIGAGIVGCSLADELTQRGWTDVTVLEQGPLWAAGGSTSHAPGLVFQTNSSRTLSLYAKYTVEKLCSLDLDGEPCFLQVGSLEIATNKLRLNDLHRRASLANAWGIPAKVISAKEAVKLFPMLDQKSIIGALHVPSDGLAKGLRADEAMGRLAIARGAKFLERHEVLDIKKENGKVTGVKTNKGDFVADVVIACAGIWGPKVGEMIGMPTAIQPLAHQLAWTKDLAGLKNEVEESTLPMVRHQDKDLYYRQRNKGLGVGWYGHRPLPVKAKDILPFDKAKVMPSVLEFTKKEWDGAIRHSGKIIPELKKSKIDSAMNGLFSFTVDGFPLMGEWAGLKGFWTAEAVWVTHSAGVARAIAEWLVDGYPSLSVHESDVNRFEKHQIGPEHIEMRGKQNYVEVYDLMHPLEPMQEPRPLRTTGFYPRQKTLGGYFLEATGYERPQWYQRNKNLVKKYKSPKRNNWAAMHWSPIIGAEAQYVRKHVGLFDITSLKRIEVSGKGALAFLHKQTTGKLDKPVGSITYCLMLTEKAGIISDITVARTGESEFILGANGNVDLIKLRNSAPDDVFVKDITAGTVGLGLFGPKARQLAQSICEDNLSNESLGYFKSKKTYLGQVPVTLWRLSYVGELGFEIYADADMGLKLWDTLFKAGKEFGLIPAGRGAFNSMRLEKGYRSYGAEMTSENNPYEAGLSFAVRKSDGFIGYDAFNKIDQGNIKKKLCCLVIENDFDVVMGKEPVRVDKEVVGYTTSAYYGHSVGFPLAYAWLPIEHSPIGTKVEIQYFDKLVKAKVGNDPQFDPTMTRLKS